MKMLRTGLFLTALTTSALAQPAPPPAREVTIKITEAELVTLWKWMEKAPFSEVGPFMIKLQQQVMPQLSPSTVAPPAPEPPK